MEASAASRTSHVLLTGPPRIGKTTVCKRVASLLERKGSRFDGFYTEEVRDERTGNRIGFDVVGVKDPERRSALARLRSLPETPDSGYRLGKYNVFPDNFEAVALPILNSDADILLIDEIGKMELFSENFKRKVTEIFSGISRKVFVIGTVPQLYKPTLQHAELFFLFRADDRISTINVCRQNRDDLPLEIMREVASLINVNV